MAKNEKKYRFGSDVSGEIREIFGLEARRWPPFCLILVKLIDLGADEAALSQTAGEVLTAAELKTFQGFRFGHRRREWLAGRLAVKEAVRRLLAEPERPLTAMEVGVDGRGKPFLAPAPCNGSSVHIAISHSGESALALVSTAPCALDFQEIRSSLARVESRFASVDELGLVQPCHEDTLKALGLLWAGKEALRKYVVLWPLLGFLEASLASVVGQGSGFSLSFQPVPGRRQLPATLPTVLATLYGDNALAIIFDEGGHGG